jgi:protein disulfide-isomerase A1
MWCVPQMQLLFVFVERDNEEVGEPVANYFGITGQETTVMPLTFVILFFGTLIYLTETECSNFTLITLQVLAYTGNEDAKKFFFSGEMSLDNIKVISEICLEIQYQPRSKIFGV